jgi:hypothetical protein
VQPNEVLPTDQELPLAADGELAVCSGGSEAQKTFTIYGRNLTTRRPGMHTSRDDLEERLHQLICGGNLDLTTARRDVATNWIAAYKKYLHIDRPLPRSSHLI